MAATYEHLRSLVNDPANDDRPFAELADEAWRYGADGFVATLTPAGRALRDEIGFGDDAAIACEPMGFMRQVLNPLPLEITQYDDRLVVRYEAENAVRTVYLDGRAPPPDTLPSRLGHSTGRYEDGVLVIETKGTLPGEYWPEAGGSGHSEAPRTAERYIRSDDGSWLRLEVTFDDPVMLTEPTVYQVVWRFTPDAEMLETGECEEITGQP